MSPGRAPRQQLPLWARWAAAIVVAIAVIAGVVIAVNRAGPEGVAASEGGAEAEVSREADGINSFELLPVQNRALPAFTAGAHVIVEMTGRRMED